MSVDNSSRGISRSGSPVDLTHQGPDESATMAEGAWTTLHVFQAQLGLADGQWAMDLEKSISEPSDGSHHLVGPERVEEKTGSQPSDGLK
jgi:hypothetical protein